MMENIEHPKRIRTINWEKLEKELLLEGITEYIKMIDNKGNSNTHMKIKDKCWTEIQHRLYMAGYSRELLRIKEQWRRMKGQAKKNIANYKKAQQQPDGRPAACEPSEFDYQIADILPHEFADVKSESGSDVVESPITDNGEEYDKVFCPPSPQFLPAESLLSPPPPPSIPPQSNLLGPENSRQYMTAYEENMYQLNKVQMEQTMRHAEELHQIHMLQEQLKIEQEKEIHEERIKIMRLGQASRGK